MVKHWNRLLREVVGLPCLEVLKNEEAWFFAVRFRGHGGFQLKGGPDDLRGYC